ncbi:MarR family winged helix-turn-helix transcriptional regulator [Brevibacterium limosum]|uniref:MarR family winged helix-turn-helix transcriptional regulator n=1 Tax=Brevibacterium limosum TaxID=2697565 RepID=UPI001422F8FA|nr:MarR family transcriptional regulator [Brevibacterium limosum]
MDRADTRAADRNRSDSDPSAFTADELETWSSIATLLEWLPAALDAQMQRDSQISHFEYGILFALSRAQEETLAMKELAGFANSTLSRLSRAVARLEAKDWVTRCPDPDDGRTTIASLTEAGRTAMRAATPGHVDLVRRVVFGSLTPAQARALGKASRRITSAIREEGSWHP